MCRLANAPAGLVILLFAAPPLPAQQLEDIIVTARKREESLQEVPLSISALSAEQLRERGITNNYDVALFTPNFNTNQRVGRTLDRPVIRGMGSSAVGGEPNASYFVDGVFVSSSISTAVTDAVERVEVLRGPQSAQFGRATFSGAVNYVTRQPSDDWAGQFNARAGSHSDYKASGWLSGPLIRERLAFLVSAAYVNYGGEWNNNLRAAPPGFNPFNPDPAGGYAYTGPNPPTSDINFIDPPRRGDHSSIGGEKTTDLMLKLRWTPTASTEINFKYAFTEGDDEHWPSLVPPPGVRQVNCFLPGDPGAAADTPGSVCGTLRPDGYENRINLPDFNGLQGSSAFPSDATPAQRYAPPAEPGTRRETDRVALIIEQVLGEWSATARFGYNEDSFDQVFDLDHSHMRVLAGLFHFNQQRETKDHSIEFRVDSPAEKRLRGSLGLYYYNYEDRNAVRSFTGPYVALGGAFECDPNGPGQNPTWTVRPDDHPVCQGPGPWPVTTDFPPAFFAETTNMAVFGGAELDLAAHWTLAVEARWADDEKRLHGGNGYFAKQNTTALTPRFTLRYQAMDDFMVYALAAKGNKPADWNSELFRYDVLRRITELAVTGRADPLIPPEEVADFANAAQVKEEKQWTYEIGAKTGWLDHRLTVNLAAFFIDWENQAIFRTACTNSTITATQLCFTIRENAGKTEIYGLELESNFIVNENLFLIANYGYQNGEFKEGSDGFLRDVTGNAELRGKKVSDAPNHSLVLGMLATNQLTSELDAFLRTDYVYESEKWNQSGNFNKIGSRNLVNLRLGVQAENWTLAGYVSNLLDDDTPLAALDFFDFGDTLSNGEVPKIYSLNPQRGRNYGVEFSYRFGTF